MMLDMTTIGVRSGVRPTVRPTRRRRTAGGPAAGLLLGLTLAAALGSITACTPAASSGSFTSPDPASKLYAIVRAGHERDASAVPQLIEQLNSDDQAVRMYAIGALRRITGEDHGFVYYAPPAKREEAIARWLKAYSANAANVPGADRHGPARKADTVTAEAP